MQDRADRNAGGKSAIGFVVPVRIFSTLACSGEPRPFASFGGSKMNARESNSYGPRAVGAT